MQRKRINHIKSLKIDICVVVEGEEAFRDFIAKFYTNLFFSSAGIREAELFSNVSCVVTARMNYFLKMAFSMADIMEALNSMGDLKAPSPDGKPSIFISIFGIWWGEIQDEILCVLNGGQIPVCWNGTIIVIIPKLHNPCRLKDYRPINLNL